MSNKIDAFGNGSLVLQALNGMKTIQAAGYVVNATLHDLPLCAAGQHNNLTLIFKGMSANAPKIGLWSSVVRQKTPYYYSTSNTSDVLTITTNDGRDDSVKLCNGIGRCDFTVGRCTCPYGWTSDADLGSCGGIVTNSSQWPGFGRCPGVINYNTIGNVGMPSYDDQPNYKSRFYLSFDPYTDKSSENSTIWSFLWRSDTIRGAKIDATDFFRFVNLTSATSAGPIVLDQGRNQVIFLDASTTDGFIGIAPQDNGKSLNYTRFYTFGSNYRVFGLTLDAHFARRKLYWSVPGSWLFPDGELYWAYVDDRNPTVYALSSSIGQVRTIAIDWCCTYSLFVIAVYGNSLCLVGDFQSTWIGDSLRATTTLLGRSKHHSGCQYCPFMQTRLFRLQ
jgi:hypothetical protein